MEMYKDQKDQSNGFVCDTTPVYRGPPPPAPPPKAPPVPKAMKKKTASSIPAKAASVPARLPPSYEAEAMPQAYDTSGAPPRPTGEQLQMGKSKLRGVNVGKQSVTLTRKGLFPNDDVSLDYFPLKGFDTFMYQSRRVSTFLNFTGIDQITDYVFYIIMANNLGRYVHKVHLNGCWNITDQGIEWLTLGCPNLEEIHVDCCYKITEASVLTILRNCPNMLYIGMQGTNVGNAFIPASLKEHKASLRLSGCPVLTPPVTAINTDKETLMTSGNYMNHLREKTPLKMYKAVVVGDSSTAGFSVVKLLGGSKSVAESGVQCLQGFRTTRGQATFNVVQCHEGVVDVFVSSRTLYVLPYDAGAKTHSALSSKILHILNQQPGAIFLLVPIDNPSPAKKEVTSGKSVAMADLLLAYFKELVAQLKAHLDSSIEEMTTARDVTDSDVDSQQCNFAAQDRLGRAAKLYTALQRIEQSLVFLDDNLSMTSTEAAGSVLERGLQEGAEKLEERHAHLGSFSDELTQLIQSVQPSAELVKDSDFVDALLKKHGDKLGGSMKRYWKALEYLHMLGLVVHVAHRASHTDVADSGVVCTDPHWFCDTLGKAAVPGGHHWTGEDLLRSLAGNSTNQVELWRSALTNCGIMCSRAQLVHNTLSLPDTRPENPYFRRYLASKESEYCKTFNVVVKTFTFHHRVSQTLIAQMISSPVVSGSPLVDLVLAWRTGFVTQQVPVEVMVQLSDDAGSVVLVAQMPRCDASLEDEHKATLLFELGRYSVLLEYLLQAAGTPYQCELKFNGEPETKSSDNYGVVFGCQFGEATEQGLRCGDCRISTSDAALLWTMKSSLQPVFSEQYIVSTGTWDKEVHTDTIVSHGPNKITTGSKITTPSDGMALKVSQALDPVYFKSVTIHAMNKVAQVMLNNIHAESNLEVGDVVEFRVSPGETCSKQEVTVLRNKAVVHRSMRPRTESLRACVTTQQMSHLYITATQAANRICSAASKVKVGMRLEAKDKKTPSLICCTTVTDVNYAEKQVYIHFDGWDSGSYDYWASFDDPELHPVGWISQQTNLSGIRPDLQPPKSCSLPHIWDDYLVSEKSLPVPYSFFTKEQTNNCKPYKVPVELLRLVGQCGDYEPCFFEQTNNCKPYKVPVELLRLVGQSGGYDSSRASSVAALMKTFESVSSEQTADKGPGDVLLKTASAPPLRLLKMPSDLTLQMLVNPYMDMLVEGSKNSTIHLLCPYLTFPHFTTSSTATVLDRSNVLDVFHFDTLCKVISSKAFLPGSFTNIFPMFAESGLNAKQVSEAFLKIFRMLLFLFLRHTTDRLDNTFAQKLQKKKTENTQAANKLLGRAETVTLGDVLCRSHQLALKFSESGKSHVQVADFEGCESFIDLLHLAVVKDEEANQNGSIFQPKILQELPTDLFTSFENLGYLDISRQKISSLPQSITRCTGLTELYIRGNPIATFPDGFEACVRHLETLDIGQTQLESIPGWVFEASQLVTLVACQLAATSLSAGIGKLKKLEHLDISSTLISSLPGELGDCQELTYLNISGVPWYGGKVLNEDSATQWFESHPVLAKIQAKTKMLSEEFVSLDEGDKGFLNEAEISKFNNYMFTKIPRFKPTGPDDETGGVPRVLERLTKLTELHMEYQAISRLPGFVQALASLNKLGLGHCPLLESVAAEVGSLPLLQALNLNGCPSLKTPPKEIVMKGFRSVMGYLWRLQMGSVSCKRTKLMLVGLGGAGKTSLVQKLTRGSRYSDYGYSDTDMGQEITDGIDIVNWAVPVDGDHVTYSVWDFAGQSVYYNTHQFFLSNRAVYLLLWNMRLGHEHAGLEFWLSSIACHAPKAPVLVVGTHRDQVEKYWLPKEQYSRQYPQIKGFHEISCYTNAGVKELQAHLLEVTLEEKYMGEKIPEAWLNFEDVLTKTNKKEQAALSVYGKDIIEWKTVEDQAAQCGIYDRSEIVQAVGFLHDLGAVQHFQNELLRSLVVINPQWIVDAMACVVNVRNTPIKEGRLSHSDLAKVWESYPQGMLQWLLRLTEEFDLTFALTEEHCNLVPCLLPAEPPEYKWPNFTETDGFRETKMEYAFTYLPAGLFNRVQVRLCQYSDSSVIWKNGSKLVKNGHHALITTLGEKKVLVKVQGYRPENILFLVHEVFEGLIATSFHGVTYDFSIPCPDCLKKGSHDPCMFTASKIQRATELKAPFLQCDKYFHTVSLTELHAAMPPEKHTEFDLHLERSLHALDDLHDDLTNDVVMIYAKADIPELGEDSKKVAPRKIYDDLRKNDLKIWFPADPSTIDLQTHALTLRNAKVALVCISDSFVADKHLCDVLHFLRTNLLKPIQLVVLGKSLQWKNSNTGLLLSDDVFVNMMKIEKYPTKFIDLMDALRTKASVSKMKLTGPAPATCFISYSWANSRDAVSKGSRQLPGALGWADPRAFKNELEKSGVFCWLDVERVGQGGLFEDIAEGLRRAKVMLACVSDEYAKSRNCQMEFRFANVTLDIPIVVAVVGTGYAWESTEVGMLSIGHAKLNLQDESPAAMQRLVAEVKAKLPPEDDSESEAGRTPSPADNSQIAYQELLELAQRKFQRQLSTMAERMESSVAYPLLLLLDFLTNQERGDLCTSQAQPAEHISTVIEDQTFKKLYAKAAEEDDRLQRQKEGQKGQGGGAERGEEAPPTQASRPNSAASRARPGSAKPGPTRQLSKRPSAMTAVLAAMVMNKSLEVTDRSQYCIRFLCEHERGWHCHGAPLPLPEMSGEEWERFTEQAAPYLARLFAILKHAPIDELPILHTEQGALLRKRFEEKCGLEADISEHYADLRNAVIQLDTNLQRGQLKRCHLPSGKQLWLCPEHQQEDSRITVFNDEATDLYSETYVSENIDLAPSTELQGGKHSNESQGGKHSESQGGKHSNEQKSTTQKETGKSPESPREITSPSSQRHEQATRQLKRRVTDANAQAAANSMANKSRACRLM